MSLLSMIFPDNIEHISAYVIGNTGSGKTNFLVDIGATYATQAFNVLHLSGENTVDNMTGKYIQWGKSHNNELVIRANVTVRELTSAADTRITPDQRFDVIIYDALQHVPDCGTISIADIRSLLSLNGTVNTPAIWMSLHKSTSAIEQVPQMMATKVFLNSMNNKYNEQTIEIIQPIIKTTKRVISVDHEKMIFKETNAFALDHLAR
jgi:hypothetical protein